MVMLGLAHHKFVIKTSGEEIERASASTWTNKFVAYTAHTTRQSS